MLLQRLICPVHYQLDLGDITGNPTAGTAVDSSNLETFFGQTCKLDMLQLEILQSLIKQTYVTLVVTVVVTVQEVEDNVKSNYYYSTNCH